ncbi:hypothetical protein FA95DRAFT_81333 [Auriscalpium vulgare]|uniref:Uncharacterized protein n=1 Tax=Auriscalpium vulgare TaxID=40419 RepID=A0ACB8RNS9_9AGAM|nr:hypothetical protein FA95DRAFT_81333 [Auriscalpium vulgare]
MTNFHDPSIIQADYLAFIKFLHLIDGIYIWEYFMSLEYEWSVLTGKRPYRWTIWIYSITRFGTLMAVVMNLIGFNVTSKMNCQTWTVFLLIFAYGAFVAASSLIVLRIAAIWNRNRFAVALAVATWSTNIGFLLHDTITARSVWIATASSCGFVNSAHSRNNIIVTFTTDFVLCCIVIAGLLRTRRLHGTMGIWTLLYKQGLIWLGLAVVAQIPPTVFIILNLNDPWNLMFQTSSLIVMTIGATRMYRALSNFSAAGFGDSSAPQPRSNAVTSVRFMRKTENDTSVIPMSRLEVSVHTAYENYPEIDKPVHLGDGDDIGKQGSKAF